jgi:Uma2 family endonuclease
VGDRALVRFDGPITLADSEPEPDITIVRWPKSQYRDRHPGADGIFWLIEYANSTLVEDWGEKPAIYATAKIPEYWMVEHLTKKQLRVFQQPEGDAYRVKRTLVTGIIQILASPDIAFAISKIIGLTDEV